VELEKRAFGFVHFYGVEISIPWFLCASFSADSAPRREKICSRRAAEDAEAKEIGLMGLWLLYPRKHATRRHPVAQGRGSF